MVYQLNFHVSFVRPPAKGSEVLGALLVMIVEADSCADTQYLYCCDHYFDQLEKLENSPKCMRIQTTLCSIPSSCYRILQVV